MDIDESFFNVGLINLVKPINMEYFIYWQHLEQVKPQVPRDHKHFSKIEQGTLIY